MSASTTVHRLNQWVSDRVDDFDGTGLSLAVVARGKVQWSAGWGWANREKHFPVTPETPFMLGSISKVVTGTAIMQAAEQGRVDLDAPVVWLDPLPHAFTLRHLASHTSGILDNPEALEASYGAGDPEISMEVFLRDYLSQPEHFSLEGSGKRESYSNVGIALAAHVLQEATAVPLDVWCQERIFTPLGMHNTHWFLRGFPVPERVAVPYNEKGSPLAHYGYPTWPDGQLRSSAQDMGRFLAAILNGGHLEGKQILQAETLSHMVAEQFPEVPKKKGQALFWERNRGLIGHMGGDHGVLTALYFDPESKVGVVVLTNSSRPEGVLVVQNLLKDLLREGRLTSWLEQAD